MRTHSPSKRRRPLGLVLLLSLTCSACGPEAYRDPIAKFQDASSVVIASTRVYITELNKVERDKYLLGQAADRAKIELADIETAQVFSQDGLKARLDALNQLAGYGDLLSKLANIDAPERIRAESADLGEALRNLTTLLEKEHAEIINWPEAGIHLSALRRAAVFSLVVAQLGVRSLVTTRDRNSEHSL